MASVARDLDDPTSGSGILASDLGEECECDGRDLNGPTSGSGTLASDGSASGEECECDSSIAKICGNRLVRLV